MSKAFAVLKREYLQTVRKKTFIIMTILAPFLMAAMMFVPVFFMERGLGEKKIAVVDGSGKLEQAIREGVAGGDRLAEGSEPGSQLGQQQVRAPQFVIEYAAPGADVDLKTAAQPQLARLNAKDVKKDQRLDGVLLIPAAIFENTSAVLTYYSRSSSDLIAQERLGRIVSRAVSRERLAARGLDPAEMDRMLRDLKVDAVQLSRSGEEKQGGEASFMLGFVFALLLFMPSFFYGQEVMRGIVQEKTDRIVEILISSMSPVQLLSGKILGLAAVGLTQLAVWIGMGAVLAAVFGGAAMTQGIDVARYVEPDLLAAFVVFFLLGYLIYVSVYAVAGAIANSEKEAQQFLMPVMMVLLVPWFLMGPILLNPESTLSTALSLVPVYTPITMFIRVLISQPPAWQVALSVVLSILTVLALLWVTAKIFRLGILSYGKRPSPAELWRWVKAA